MAQENRKYERTGVRIRAEARESSGGARRLVWVTDLSHSGFRMECVNSLDENRTLFLTLPGMAGMEAHIAWRAGNEYGCRFVQPLHPAVFDHIADRFPAIR